MQSGESIGRGDDAIELDAVACVNESKFVKPSDLAQAGRQVTSARGINRQSFAHREGGGMMARAELK